MTANYSTSLTVDDCIQMLTASASGLTAQQIAAIQSNGGASAASAAAGRQNTAHRQTGDSDASTGIGYSSPRSTSHHHAAAASAIPSSAAASQQPLRSSSSHKPGKSASMSCDVLQRRKRTGSSYKRSRVPSKSGDRELLSRIRASGSDAYGDTADTFYTMQDGYDGDVFAGEDSSAAAAAVLGGGGGGVATAATDDIADWEKSNKMVSVSVDDKFILSQDICAMCGSLGTDLEGRLIVCTQCGQSYHPYCVSVKVTEVILQKGWRCLDCTVCEGCAKKDDEANLILCDECDISYHIYCMSPPLKAVPMGPWKCKWCSICRMCNSRDPGQRRLWFENHTICGPCHSLSTCDVCFVQYDRGDLVIRCSVCHHWLHTVCDMIMCERDAQQCCRLSYACPACRDPNNNVPPHLLRLQRHNQRSKADFERHSAAHVRASQAADARLAAWIGSSWRPASPEAHSRISFSGGNITMCDNIALTEVGLAVIKSQMMDKARVGNKVGRKVGYKVNSGSSVGNDAAASASAPSSSSSFTAAAAGMSEADSVSSYMDSDCPTGDGGGSAGADVTGEFGASPKPDHASLIGPPSIGVDGRIGKKRTRDLSRVGIGGFSFKQRDVRPAAQPNLTASASASVNGKETEDAAATETEGGAGKSVTRKRSKRIKLASMYPEFIREAFFGKPLDASSSAAEQFHSVDLQDWQAMSDKYVAAQAKKDAASCSATALQCEGLAAIPTATSAGQRQWAERVKIYEEVRRKRIDALHAELRAEQPRVAEVAANAAAAAAASTATMVKIEADADGVDDTQITNRPAALAQQQQQPHPPVRPNTGFPVGPGLKGGSPVCGQQGQQQMQMPPQQHQQQQQQQQFQQQQQQHHHQQQLMAGHRHMSGHVQPALVSPMHQQMQMQAQQQHLQQQPPHMSHYATGAPPPHMQQQPQTQSHHQPGQPNQPGGQMVPHGRMAGYGGQVMHAGGQPHVRQQQQHQQLQQQQQQAIRNQQQVAPSHGDDMDNGGDCRERNVLLKQLLSKSGDSHGQYTVMSPQQQQPQMTSPATSPAYSGGNSTPKYGGMTEYPPPPMYATSPHHHHPQQQQPQQVQQRQSPQHAYASSSPHGHSPMHASSPPHHVGGQIGPPMMAGGGGSRPQQQPPDVMMVDQHGGGRIMTGAPDVVGRHSPHHLVQQHQQQQHAHPPPPPPSYHPIANNKMPSPTCHSMSAAAAAAAGSGGEQMHIKRTNDDPVAPSTPAAKPIKSAGGRGGRGGSRGGKRKVQNRASAASQHQRQGQSQPQPQTGGMADNSGQMGMAMTGPAEKCARLAPNSPCGPARRHESTPPLIPQSKASAAPSSSTSAAAAATIAASAMPPSSSPGMAVVSQVSPITAASPNTASGNNSGSGNNASLTAKSTATTNEVSPVDAELMRELSLLPPITTFEPQLDSLPALLHSIHSGLRPPHASSQQRQTSSSFDRGQRLRRLPAIYHLSPDEDPYCEGDLITDDRLQSSRMFDYDNDPSMRRWLQSAVVEATTATLSASSTSHSSNNKCVYSYDQEFRSAFPQPSEDGEQFVTDIVMDDSDAIVSDSTAAYIRAKAKVIRIAASDGDDDNDGDYEFIDEFADISGDENDGGTGVVATKNALPSTSKAKLTMELVRDLCVPVHRCAQCDAVMRPNSIGYVYAPRYELAASVDDAATTRRFCSDKCFIRHFMTSYVKSIRNIPAECVDFLMSQIELNWTFENLNIAKKIALFSNLNSRDAQHHQDSDVAADAAAAEDGVVGSGVGCSGDSGGGGAQKRVKAIYGKWDADHHFASGQCSADVASGGVGQATAGNSNSSGGNRKLRRLNDTELTNLMFSMGSTRMASADVYDGRRCALCRVDGDRPADGPGRLLSVGVDQWVHVNCALWSDTVYETVAGALVNVESAMRAAAVTPCSMCRRSGASVPCAKNRCTSIYHLSCAIHDSAVFFGNKAMYCSVHASSVVRAENLRPMHSLAVLRNVYVHRDERAEVAALLEFGLQTAQMRIGALTVHCVGDLSEAAACSGRFNTADHIFPLGYRATRYYWSSRQASKRAEYLCTIEKRVEDGEDDDDDDDDDEDNGSANRHRDVIGWPDFVVVADPGTDHAETYRGPSPSAVWQQIMADIQAVQADRTDVDVVKIFSQYVSGADMFGLDQPQVVKVLESMSYAVASSSGNALSSSAINLPGYCRHFKVGELYDVPRRLCQSGCARCEPLSTWTGSGGNGESVKSHHRRSQRRNGSGGMMPASSGDSFLSLDASSSDTAWAASASALSSSSSESCPLANRALAMCKSASLLNSKKAQLRRMRTEWRLNVVLARSHIQGLGLYAARDLEPDQMVIEYIGQTIRAALTDVREKRYEAEKRGIYMFRLTDDLVLDATMEGGMARYINHSCQPSCRTQVVQSDRGLHVVIIANRSIAKGEELSYDYKFDLEDEDNKIACLCGASTCRKWMN